MENANQTVVAIDGVPEPGQLVEVRRRQWVVSNVEKSAFASENGSFQHLVTLESLDEDALGEELAAIWELEPGAKILERVGLPEIDGYDSNEQLDAFLDAVRWGAATNVEANVLQSPFRSGILIEDYQLEPLVRSLDMARVNLLIADDVGLGKTIEAGLVVQELLLRHRARTVLVVCPASLQIKWQTEMREKFGLDFRIVDTSYVKKLRRERGLRVNPWTSYPRLITSMDWAKSDEQLRLLKDVLPLQRTYPRPFDVLIVDEAHNVAPTGSSASRETTESQRTRLIRLIAPHFTHHLFLSATPHNGYQSSFTALLELLDDQRFARSVLPKPEKLQQVMVRRLKSDITDEDGNSVFPYRELKPLEIDYTDEERDIHKTLQEFSQLRLSGAFDDKLSRMSTEFVNILLKKRLFSSPAAFERTFTKHRESLLNPKQKQAKKPDEKFLLKAIQKIDEDVCDEAEIEDATDEFLDVARRVSSDLSERERELMEKLHKWSQQASLGEDSKAKAILTWLENNIRCGGQWTDNRVILFTEYLDTLSWLQTILANHGYGGDRLATITGGMNSDEREEIKKRFQASPKQSRVRILLATDAASEGIDLQNYCNNLIHVEIPWNPNVMEQRNGRIDRHGQKADHVTILHPVGKGFSEQRTYSKPGDLEGDQEYLWRVAQKVNSIRNDLGSVGSVIVEQIENAMLRGGTSNELNLDSEETNERRRKADVYVKSDREIKSRIAKLHERLWESRSESRLDPINVAKAVNVALKIAKKPELVSYELRETSSIKTQDAKGVVFTVPELPGSWGRALAGLEHPFTKERRPITFKASLVVKRDDLVLVHLNHKLVQLSLRLLREEIWNLNDVKLLHRVAFKTSSKVSVPTALILSRLVVTGGDHRRLHEELIISGGEIKRSSHKRIETLATLNDLYNNSTPLDDVPSEIFSVARNLFESNTDALMKTVDARSKTRMESLIKRIDDQKRREIDNIETILDELAGGIRKELDEARDAPEVRQLTFDFVKEGDKYTQVRRDLESLKRRLDQIPDEKIKEKEAIERRYRAPVQRTFPVAVVFVLPETTLNRERS